MPFRRRPQRSPARRSALRLALGAAAVLLAACSGSGGSPGAGSTGDRSTGGSPTGGNPSASSTPATPAAAILVTNDDGVSAPGLDALVTRLRSIPGVSVVVVAPAANQSGSDGKTTPGALTRTDVTTASGFPATAVDGFPADTVRVALDDLHLRPALTVSGINRGQNVGPLVAISGTVGAARAAAARGIPAIAVSQGTPGAGDQFDYDVGADLTVQEVQKLLAAPRGGSSDTATVANLNVPSCDRGQVRGLRMLPPASSALNAAVLGPSDCTSTANPADEVTAFHDGFAVETRVPTRP